MKCSRALLTYSHTYNNPTRYRTNHTTSSPLHDWEEHISKYFFHSFFLYIQGVHAIFVAWLQLLHFETVAVDVAGQSTEVAAGTLVVCSRGTREWVISSITNASHFLSAALSVPVSLGYLLPSLSLHLSLSAFEELLVQFPVEVSVWVAVSVSQFVSPRGARRAHRCTKDAAYVCRIT